MAVKITKKLSGTKEKDGNRSVKGQSAFVYGMLNKNKNRSLLIKP
jgi:hypothetical protein